MHKPVSWLSVRFFWIVLNFYVSGCGLSGTLEEAVFYVGKVIIDPGISVHAVPRQIQRLRLLCVPFPVLNHAFRSDVLTKRQPTSVSLSCCLGDKVFDNGSVTSKWPPE